MFRCELSSLVVAFRFSRQYRCLLIELIKFLSTVNRFRHASCVQICVFQLRLIRNCWFPAQLRKERTLLGSVRSVLEVGSFVHLWRFTRPQPSFSENCRIAVCLWWLLDPALWWSSSSTHSNILWDSSGVELL